ncbi:MAG: hypothetical protein JGK17_26470 [Microcoleus sp. PH2017_10_PVI_O_A]|uniref:hypothetical protein n=1 Tax=unclassified Microcoleus TaxID=2642155 RepID=UPI001DC5C756|nr:MULTISPECIES: hypothetical protein [unclassified Microcoleus]TAE77635.1 MAG: hypothetical protein EAZ83_26145 [Oscillatoriales cyanobacterium]MCC3409055.1 hypothetical protein [Microcoleus sp. PH2017_10_PVI_O_A]MCC3463171.1 hypothetical protein [Microcoleus sp. PH2017_11_PCY_U_A]MCC3481605.1 hypothetical protein [Microcoleus sp. PH2017_12_PCY_D_A]MCC3562542.1 hypothetical protein [Microcoleus sp. PH2017_27_LUM_O_A]
MLKTNNTINPPAPNSRSQTAFSGYDECKVDRACWLGWAGFRDCLFQAIIVGEPAPTANDFEGDFVTGSKYSIARAVRI